MVKGEGSLSPSSSTWSHRSLGNIVMFAHPPLDQTYVHWKANSTYTGWRFWSLPVCSSPAEAIPVSADSNVSSMSFKQKPQSHPWLLPPFHTLTQSTRKFCVLNLKNISRITHFLPLPMWPSSSESPSSLAHKASKSHSLSSCFPRPPCTPPSSRWFSLILFKPKTDCKTDQLFPVLKMLQQPPFCLRTKSWQGIPQHNSVRSSRACVTSPW